MQWTSLLVPLILLGIAFMLLPSIESNKKTVLIVGGGAAGMAAGLELSENEDLEIIIFDKEKKLGGNSAKASSGINGVNSNAQREQGIEDSIELFESDIIVSGQSLANLKLVHHLAESSTSAIEFLESNGIDLGLLSQCGGHHKPRTHRSRPDPLAKFQKNIGSIITGTLLSKLKEKNNVKLYSQSEVTKLIKSSSGKVSSIQVNGTLEYNGDAIILASGGYGRDIRLLEEFRPDYMHLPSTNGNWTTGDGVHLARDIGASLVSMEHVQVHPTGIIDPKNPTSTSKFLAAEAIRAGGALLINQKGNRFVNELGLRDQVTKGIFDNCESLPESDKQIFSYMILNEDVIEFFGSKIMSFYQSKGFLIKYESAEEFAKENNIPFTNLKNTLESYNTAKDNNLVDEFGKDRFPTSYNINEPLYSFMITPSIHYTMGGVEINQNSEVIDKDGNIISGLYAAGEVSGGLHGKNRLAGNSLLECIVFGRTAASSVLTYLK